MLLPLLLATLAACCAPAAQAYTRGSVTGNLGDTPLHRSDAANIQFVVPDGAVPGLTNADGRIVITPASDPAAALRAAVETWSNITTAGIHFEPVEPGPAAYDPGDGKHVFIFLDTPEIRSVVGSALAVTRLAFSPAGEITDSDILFNPDIARLPGLTAFSTTRDSPGTVDIQTIATHELGHALGAGHSGMGAAMFNGIAGGSDFASHLSHDDIAFATEAYPAPGANAPFGMMSGNISAVGGPVTGVLVTAVDSQAGIVLSAITDLQDGTYRMTHVPPGDYVVAAEPLDGPAVPTDFQFVNLSRFNTDVRPRFAGGNAVPVRFRVQAGRETTASATVESGSSAVSITRVGVAPPGTAGQSTSLTAGPVLLPAGQASDLLLLGTGIDSTVAEQDVRLLAPGVTIRPGSVMEDPRVTGPGGQPILRMTVDVAPRSGRAYGSIVVIKGSAAALHSGGLVIATPAPAFEAAGLVNAASFVSGGVPPGGIVSIFGTGLGPDPGQSSVGFDAETGRLASELANVRVTFDGVPAPLFFVSQRQINLQAPFEIAGAARSEVVVEFNGLRSRTVTVPVVASHPGVFTMEGGGQAIVLNQDNSRNSVSNPARRGQFVTVFATGQGLVDPPMATGQPAPANPLSDVTNVSVTIAGRQASDIFFSGMTPGFVGLLQINVRVPPDVTPGASVPLLISMQGAPSQPGVMIAVE